MDQNTNTTSGSPITPTTVIEQKILQPKNGLPVLAGTLLGMPVAVAMFVACASLLWGAAMVVGVVISIVLFFACIYFLCGVKFIHPNEALVLTLFGNYYGTLNSAGCFYVNPLCSAAGSVGGISASANSEGNAEVKLSTRPGRVSLKLNTLKNEKQKVNDALGNPILIGTNVVWRVTNPTAAVFNVESYANFISIQTDSTIRNIARLYPYDLFNDDDGDDTNNEKTLRGSAQEIAANMRDELQRQVAEAGIVIEEVKITDLAYAEEIASAMLQRQQAVAIIAARTKIVDGAVGMVKLALDRLSEDEIVVLDDERKAAMVSNLLVVLCSGKDTQPIVNSGSIY